MLRPVGLMALAAALTALALLVSTGEARAHGGAPAVERAAPPPAVARADAGGEAERPCCHAAAGAICAALTPDRAGLAGVGAPAPAAPPSAPGRLRALAAPAPGVPPPISGRG
ncbi:hypothetical protein [Albimonas pacifica]|uniref:Uncharacterized protein n=1 Tax=Albimonas pacifica TaxID=1114924 RepID=A0A1I3NAE1_9RHOB|nr:hypothetical protein [Albimonas pacifica]SFJ06268.1 hypothetical protein SAMN05216258_11311 [Albimonas pacifica]